MVAVVVVVVVVLVVLVVVCVCVLCVCVCVRACARLSERHTMKDVGDRREEMHCEAQHFAHETAICHNPPIHNFTADRKNVAGSQQTNT
jgi:hypothetical protein